MKGAQYVAAHSGGGPPDTTRSGEDQLLSFDMGGTSTDVSIIDKDIGFTTSAKIGGHPVAVPMVDMHTIGSGGGSIAEPLGLSVEKAAEGTIDVVNDHMVCAFRVRAIEQRQAFALPQWRPTEELNEQATSMPGIDDPVAVISRAGLQVGQEIAGPVLITETS